MSNFVNGFSKKKKLEKIDWIISNHFHNNKKAKDILFSYLNDDKSIQNLHDEFIENNSTRQELDNDVKLLLEKIRKDYFND